MPATAVIIWEKAGYLEDRIRPSCAGLPVALMTARAWDEVGIALRRSSPSAILVVDAEEVGASLEELASIMARRETLGLWVGPPPRGVPLADLLGCGFRARVTKESTPSLWPSMLNRLVASSQERLSASGGVVATPSDQGTS
ncbi:hypothetical protein Pan216_53780 [Planctomycetes bacterium Pan216]|uniref:Response regulatory domain-containing protein n=1 Tax=Kolteria novifilia TaxID=2527975 RepID=A0A518BBX3_9BACT|nr:hypothetical protein Pan216_53780 [Planctomycetes bacterium Pan216]